MRSSRVLFVLFEWLMPTIIDSQVLSLVRDLGEGGLTFEVWALCSPGNLARSRARLAGAESLAGCPVRVVPSVPSQLPFSLAENSRILRMMLRSWGVRPNLIHARADYATAAALRAVRGMAIPVLWDCRGASAAESAGSSARYPTLTRVAAPVLRSAARRRIGSAARGCAGAVFVSEELHRLNCGVLRSKDFEIVPCSVPEDLFFFSDQVRLETRREFGFGSAPVVIYSGGTARYQGLSGLAKELGPVLRSGSATLLAVSPDEDELRRAFGDIPSSQLIVTTRPFVHMNALYNAADFGVLVREQTLVNRVASPTKFGEYCMTGLPVICNEAVAQSWDVAGQLGNRVPLDVVRRDGLPPAVSAERRSVVAARAATFYSRAAAVASLRRLYAKILRRDED